MKATILIQTLSLLFTIGIPFHNSGKTGNARPAIYPVIVSEVRTGDIVLRCGHGLLSDLFRNTSITEKLYSHAGLIVVDNGVPYVYHAIGEGGHGNGGIKKEILRSFCSDLVSKRFALYRTELSSDEMKKTVHEINRRIIETYAFDEKFDWTTDDALYCTEFIAKVLEQSTCFRIRFELDSLKGIPYLALDKLYQNKCFTQLQSDSYE